MSVLAFGATKLLKSHLVSTLYGSEMTDPSAVIFARTICDREGRRGTRRCSHVEGCVASAPWPRGQCHSSDGPTGHYAIRRKLSK